MTSRANLKTPFPYSYSIPALPPTLAAQEGERRWSVHHNHMLFLLQLREESPGHVPPHAPCGGPYGAVLKAFGREDPSQMHFEKGRPFSLVFLRPQHQGVVRGMTFLSIWGGEHRDRKHISYLRTVYP